AAAYGADSVLSFAGRRDRRVGRLVWALSLGAGSVYAVLLVLNAVRAPHGLEYDWVALAAFTTLLLAAILYARQRGQLDRAGAGAALVGLALFQLYPVYRWDTRLEIREATTTGKSFLRPTISRPSSAA